MKADVSCSPWGSAADLTSNDVVSERPAGSSWRLPFCGRAESYQVLGTGRMDVAKRLSGTSGWVPVPFDGTRALLQLSLIKWTQSPIGPFCSSFAGIVVSRGPTDRPQLPAQDRGAFAVLSAFLNTPNALWVPRFAVGDVPGGATGSAVAARRFGQEALGMETTDAQFGITRGGGVVHLQAWEQMPTDFGRVAVTGYALSFSSICSSNSSSNSSSTAASLRSDRLAGLGIAARMLLDRVLRPHVLRSFRPSRARAALLVPHHTKLGQTVAIETRFASRPRLFDLSSDRRASFSALVLDRPAPQAAMGAWLESVDFTPCVLAWDPNLAGSIGGKLGPSSKAHA